ncbi:hypothetical protein HDV03_001020 [Kappamyces sp. JEL0829]|nr:hypothetical protein HDV03_001020 [Kappamyces sp. JEL0829]KAJ3337997.1 hypothetical protein HDU91_001335 [Kappamyces sp. JEL0680]
MKELLDGDDWFTPQAESVLEEIFKRFDVDNDRCLNAAELQAFAVAANGAPFSSQEVAELREYFDCSASGDLTWTGFKEMYHMQSMSEPDVTRKDFTALGFEGWL